MKQLFIFFFVIINTAAFTQEVKVQKEILTLPKTNLVTDFNLKTNGDVVPVTVSKAVYKDIGFSFVGHQFQYMKGDFSLETLTFQNKKLSQSTTQYNYGNFMKPQGFKFIYTYDSKGNVSKRTSKASDSDYISETFYTHSNNKIQQIRETGTYDSGEKYDKIINYIYKGNSISYDFENGTKDYEIKNGLIVKEMTFNKSANKNYINTYKYNANGFLTNLNQSAYNATYTLNEKNLIATEVNKSYTQTFKYAYDKYGNWVIAYPLSTNNKKLYGSQFSYYIREIKYSNGEVTGSVDPDNDVTKTYVIKFRTELYKSLVEPNVTFRRTANSSYLFKINSQQEARNTNSGFMYRSLLVFHKPTKQLYICEDFGDKEEGKDFPAKKLTFDTTNGYWYKTPEGGVHVFTNDGTYVSNTTLYEYAPNQIDVVFKGDELEEKVILENYKNVKTNTVYPITKLSTYIKKNDNKTLSAQKLEKSQEEYNKLKKENTNVKTTNVSTTKSFSGSQISEISACKKDAECAATFFNKLHISESKSVSSDKLSQKMTNHFESLYNIDSKLAYDMLFKIDSDTFKTINIKSLPKEIQTDLRDKAQGIMNGYNKFMKDKGY